MEREMRQMSKWLICSWIVEVIQIQAIQKACGRGVADTRKDEATRVAAIGRYR